MAEIKNYTLNLASVARFARLTSLREVSLRRIERDLVNAA